MEKNYLIRQAELLSKTRRQVHKPTRMERNPKAYTRKVKHKKAYAYD